MLETFPNTRVERFADYELDPQMGEAAAAHWSGTALNLQIGDFTKAEPDSDNHLATLLICNPPYVRHHHISGEEKTRLRAAAAKVIGFEPSGLTGLYCYFLLSAHKWMAKGGLAGWLVPSEFMDVNYGEAVKSYLLNQVTLLRVHRFDPEDTQFRDALVSSVMVWFKNVMPLPDQHVQFSFGGTLANPKLVKPIPIDTLRKSHKWTPLINSSRDVVSSGARTTLGDLFYIKRGIATGNNKFFILTEADAIAHGLPAEFLTPILPSPRHLPSDEIQADESGNPIIERKLFLVNCDLGENEVEAKYPMLWSYLMQGAEVGVRDRYLCRNKEPWYRQEQRPPAKILCTYMGRRLNGNNSNPFRFILNHSLATAANVYLMLYPKEEVTEALRGYPELASDMWHALGSISAETLIREGRVYGGGLYKLEPKELANVPVDQVLAVLPRLALRMDL